MRVANLTLLTLLGAAAATGTASGQERIVDVRQGTDIAIALAPDGGSLVIDLLGQLWQLPVTGGGAVPLTPQGEGAKHPRFSPDGTRIVYQRRIGGQQDLWLLDLEQNTREALTADSYDDREPDFLDDSTVVFASNRSGNYDLWAIKLDSGQEEQLTSEIGDASFPSVSGDGVIVYVRRDSESWSLRTLSREFGNLELYTSNREISAPVWRPGGGVVIFHETDRIATSELRMLVLSDERVMKKLTGNEDVFAVRPAWISPAQYLYTADGQIWRRGIAAQRREPVHLFAAVTVEPGTRQPIDLATDATESRLARGFAGQSVSADGGRRVFSALGDLWLEEDDSLERLTDDPFLDVDPVLLPDGTGVVFASDRDGIMRLWLMDLESRASRRLPGGSGKAYRPAVDPAGTQVAYLETRGFGPWAPAELRILNLESEETDVVVARGLMNAGRPSWRINDSGGALEVAATVGNPGSGQRVIRYSSGETDVRAEASTQVLAGGAIILDGAAPEWRPPTAPASYVVQAGRLFDGIRGSYRRHVDIHIEGRRIKAITGRGVLPLPERVIDAREQTVMPGFIDVHTHQSSLAGEKLGRIWLAHGVTTVREVALDTAEAIARGEAWASGRQLGPRLVVSPPQLALTAQDDSGIASSVTGAPLLSPDRVLSGPVHEPASHAAARLITMPRRSLGLAETGRVQIPLELRSSPLRSQYQDVFSIVAAAGYVTNTVIGTAGATLSPDRARLAPDLFEMFESFYTADEQRYWLDAPGNGAMLEPRQRRIARLIRSGARVALGSDSPVVPYGLGLHRELELLSEAGIPNDQVLRIATAEGALALGLDRELGTLEPGKLADFIVIDGDPLTRLSDAARVRAVVLGGEWIERESLLADP